MSKQVRITLEPLGRTITVEWGASLREVLHAYGVEFPCGGQGRCRGCRVRQSAGSVPVGPEEEGLLTGAEIRDGWRLACRVTVEEDLTLEVGQWQTVILADHSPFGFAPRDGFAFAGQLVTQPINNARARPVQFFRRDSQSRRVDDFVVRRRALTKDDRALGLGSKEGGRVHLSRFRT